MLILQRKSIPVRRILNEEMGEAGNPWGINYDDVSYVE